MKPLVNGLLESLERRKMTAYVYRDRSDKEIGGTQSINTDIRIEYSPNSEMKVSNLKPEFPPYVRFDENGISYSSDDRDWKKAPAGSGYEILRLFDPRFVLRHTVIEHEDEENLSGICSVLLVTRSEFLDKYLSDMSLRKVTFKLHNGLLYEMTRKDFPPSKDIVRLVFTYADFSNTDREGHKILSAQ